MNMHAIFALTMGIGLLFALPVHAQTSSIPLDTIGSGPRSGTLDNGVDWTVNVGAWIPPQGYTATPAQSPQVWTFDPASTLRFGIAGLNGGGECVRVPEGTVAESISPLHNWFEDDRLVCMSVSSTSATSIFRLDDPQTELVLEIVNLNGFGRGPTFIEVTLPPPEPPLPPGGSGSPARVPVLPPFALMLLSLLFGSAGWWTLRRKAG